MSGTSETSRKSNPYVGPWPIPRGRPLYGRDRELRDLFDLLVARRIVVLHSPSGAGKTSLVQAALIPRLRRERFDVWRTVRLNLERGGGNLEGAVGNRFVASTLASLEDGVPERRRRPFSAIAGTRLAKYLEGRPRREGAPESVVLIFDQFEEVLTLDPHDTDAKRDFFVHLGEALRHPDYWALFVLREDHLAGLSPYRDLVPTKLANAYRIDLLGPEAACAAIVETAREGGREFPAAGELVEELRTMRVQRADGSFMKEKGPHVEPVQLQVVCRDLWQRMPADDDSIDAEDLERFGDVDEALGRYYRASVSRAAGGDELRERQIRNWFGERLITAGGVRGQVLREADASGGLANGLVEELLDSHLIRADNRAGATWYELAHDRLVEPVQKDNAAWRDQHLSKVERRAAQWEDEGRPSGLLLRGQELEEGERWAEESSASLTEGERLFVEESRKARQRRQEQRQARLRKVAIVEAVLIVVALGAAGFAWRMRIEAEHQAEIAHSSRLAMAALSNVDERPDLAWLLAVEAWKTDENLETKNALLSTLQSNRRLRAMFHPGDESTEVSTIAFSSDGKTLAAASPEGAVWLWEVESGRSLGRPLTGQAGSKVALSPDGTILVTAEGGTLRLWDVKSGEQLGGPLIGHSQSVGSVAFSKDGATLASWSDDDTLRLWDVESCQQIGKPLINHSDTTVESIAFSPDGMTLALGGFDGTLRLWNVASHKPLGELLASHDDPVWSVAFSPDGAILASGNEDNTVRLWNAASHQPLGEPLAGHSDLVNRIAFSPDGKILASGSDDGTVRLWDVESHQPLGEPLVGHSKQVRSVVFSPDGAILASGSDDGTVWLWEVKGRQPLGEPLPSSDDWGRTVAFSPPDPSGAIILASGSDDGTVRLWDVESHQPLGEPLVGHSKQVSSVVFSPDGEILASGSDDGKVRLWEVGSDQPLCEPLTGHDDSVLSVAFRPPDGAILASGSKDETVRLWDVEKCEGVGEPLTDDDGQFRSVAFSPDGMILASGSSHGKVWLWDVASHEQIGKPLTGHGGWVNSVAFSPDGARLALGGNNHTVRLWDVASHEQIGKPLAGHDGKVLSVAFSPDGTTLASGSDDGTVRLWDVESHLPLGEPLTGDGAPVHSVAFSPDGTTLVSGSEDGTVWLWDVDPKSWVDQACRRANRNLSCDEWRQYLGPKVPYRRTCPDLPRGDGAPRG